VLAILAEKMGAADILAIDLDEWSINNTLENIQTNNCHKIRVIQSDHLNGLAKAEIILANINLNVLKASAGSIAVMQDKGSLLLTSGFLAKDAREIESIFTRGNYQLKKLTEKDNWLSILFQKI
jgi:ribosomal protein L11 methyltransferase